MRISKVFDSHKIESPSFFHPTWADKLKNAWKNEHYTSTALADPTEANIKDILLIDDATNNTSLVEISNKIGVGIKELRYENPDHPLNAAFH